VPSGAPAPSSSSPPPPAGDVRALEVESRPLRARVAVTLWTPAGVADGTPLPLLAVHDGPEYEARAGLTEIAAALIEGGRAPAHRIALLHPGPRDDWYSASALYARALAGEILPALGRAVAVAQAPVGMGASLGGLAMLHAQRRHPAAFGGLFLQSASFFMPRFDHIEKDFGRYGRIVRFVRGVLREEPFERPVPTTLTVGRDEDNLHNNRRVAAALKLQGYPAALHEAPGGHDYDTWRAALEAHLGDLLTAAWAAD
jgi:enterochelin esterase family protein